MSPARRTGMVLGKFMPPHAGHKLLVRFAREFVDELYVVVGTLRREPIAGELRYAWMREMFPDCRVLHLTDDNPQDPAETPDFWRIWEESLRRILPEPIDCVFASEAYGTKLAEVLGATFVPCDRSRSCVDISATRIREAPLRHWEHLPECVRPYFLKRVCVYGPESTGKTTLARDLAAYFHTVWVPEYARTWLEHNPDALTAADFDVIARGQLALERSLARQADRLMFCDTDIRLTTLWSRRLTGDCAPWIDEAARATHYDLHLLTDVDVPWVADPVRYLPADRTGFFADCRNLLKRDGRRFVVVRGDWETRFRTAVAAVEELLVEPAQPSGGKAPSSQTNG